MLTKLTKLLEYRQQPKNLLLGFPSIVLVHIRAFGLQKHRRESPCTFSSGDATPLWLPSFAEEEDAALLDIARECGMSWGGNQFKIKKGLGVRVLAMWELSKKFWVSLLRFLIILDVEGLNQLTDDVGCLIQRGKPCWMWDPQFRVVSNEMATTNTCRWISGLDVVVVSHVDNFCCPIWRKDQCGNRS